MKWHSTLRVFITLAFTIPMLTSCITAKLHNFIAKSESIQNTEKDRIIGIDVYKDKDNISNKEKIIFIGNQNNYILSSAGKDIADILLKFNDISADVDFLSNDPKTTFFVAQHDFTTQATFELSYKFDDKTLTPRQTHELLLHGFKMCDDCSYPTFIYSINNITGTIQDGSAKNKNTDALYFLTPVDIELSKEGATFSPLILLYPLSVVADIITAPIQLIGYVVIINSLPTMRY